jgi:hypothetical protein
VPILINKGKVKKFINEINYNGQYQDHIASWVGKSKDEKRNILIKEGLYGTEKIPAKIMMKAKPYIELFTDYILRYHEQEFEAAKQLISITDLTNPHEWFPEARKMVRKIHYHMGPTNSGKTREAINRLIKS